MTAREYLNTKMYWTQDDTPIKTVTPEDIIGWLDGYAEVVKKHAVIRHVSQQRKLLLAFAEFCFGVDRPVNTDITTDIDDFLANNCG